MLQAATAITSHDLIVTENYQRFIIVRHIRVNVW